LCGNVLDVSLNLLSKQQDRLISLSKHYKMFWRMI